MNKPSNIIPDIDLKEFIATKKIVGKKTHWLLPVKSSEVRVYGQGERSITATEKEFIEIIPNGVMKALTDMYDAPSGSLALSINVKTNSGEINRGRHNLILQTIESLVDRKWSESYHYQIDTQDIMSLTNNLINGFSTRVLNILWEKIN